MRVSDLENKYNASKTLDELIYIISERILLATIAVKYSLNPPKKGQITLRIMKLLNKPNYESFIVNDFNYFLYSLLFIVDKLRQHCIEKYSYHLHTKLIDKFISTTSGIYASEVQLDQFEEKIFLNMMKTILKYYDKKISFDENAFLNTLTNLKDIMITSKDGANFLNEIYKYDPLMFIEPWGIVPNIKKFEIE